MKVVTGEAIEKLQIPLTTFYRWVVEALTAKEHAILPPKTSLSLPGDIFFNTMPCILPYKKVEGVKMVNRYPHRTPAITAQIVLHDLESGQLLAFMDAEYITSMRTGAVAAHSIELFAKTGYRVLGLIGLGATARATLDILLAVAPNKPFTIKLYGYKDHAQRFMERYRQHKHLEFVVCADYDATVKGSDVIISCVTVAKQNFCSDDKYDEGCLVVPIHTRGFQNCDLFFDKIFGDDTGHICKFEYFNKFRSFTEVSQVITGQSKGRESDRERILVSSQS